MNITIRKATIEDKEFITTAIIEAEKSGSDIISYCKIFSISEAEFREILSNILDEDFEGQELCISGYLIAEVDGERAATMGGWLEKESGMTSSMIKSNLLMHFMDRNKLLDAAPNLKLMNEIDFHRDENSLQIEISYTVDKFRGLGLYGKLVNERLRLKLESGKTFEKIQGIVLKNNNSPVNALTKLGFVKAKEKTCTNNDILNLLPTNTKILYEKYINN